MSRTAMSSGPQRVFGSWSMKSVRAKRSVTARTSVSSILSFLSAEQENVNRKCEKLAGATTRH